jgi:glycosyltransferase involved in cell wall biosynthesis
MKIAIDITQVIYETGVSVYTRELVANLVKLYPENEYVLFGGSLRRGGELREFAKKFSKARSVITPISPTVADILWNRLHILNIEKFVGKVDVFHSSDWAEPPARASKITTIHDLSFVHYPKFTDPKVLATHKRRLYWVKKESAAVIVPSEATKKDAIKLGISAKKIHVIPEALSSIYKKQPKSEVDRVRKKYRITGRYALAVGASPRKNIARIINAFEKAKADTGLEKLAVVGRGPLSAPKKGVLFLGHVETADLPVLYSGASIFIYTSLYEGFGLPILEAFKCETPVVTSNISSMPEVAGGAAILVNPESIEEISDGILEALNKKKDLVKKGKERVKKFSWEETAKKTMGVYEG